MKILWVSNAPWVGTGYGNQTAIFPRRLKDTLGHGLTIGSFYGLEGSPRKTSDMWVFPVGRDAYSNDVIAKDAEFLEADIVITLMDVWVLHNAVTSKFRWVPWLPVDHDPVPPIVADALETAYQPIAYSQFGVRKLQECGYKPLYVPHGIETDLFKPMDRLEARASLAGCPADTFLVGIVAANKGHPSRKAFDQQIRAFAELHKRHSDTMLYLHTEMSGVSDGEYIPRIIELAGVDTKAIAHPDQYQYRRGLISQEQMVARYNSFDVLMNATRGEGFGIPILEAQACGTPVIVTDFSSMPELCFSGWKVGYSDKEFTYQNSYQVLPSVPDLVDALEEAYQQNSEKRAEMRQRARDGAMAYDADRVTAEYWKPVLETIEQRLAGKALEAVSVNGVDLEVRTGTCDAWIANEVQNVYCQDLIDYKSIIRAVDIGAHIGSWSLFVRHESPDSVVVAIEAMKENADLLRKNCNGENAYTILVMEGRVGYSDDEYEMLIDDRNTGGNTLVKKGEEPEIRGAVISERRPYEGQRITVADALGKIGGIGDVLKLDCEGGEYDILLNAPMADLTAFRWIVGEYHTDLGNVGDIITRLSERFMLRRFKPISANIGQFCFERVG